MDFTTAKTKEELIKAMNDESSGGLAFSGWDRYGRPKLNVDGIRQSLRTLMAHPAYDKDVEQMVLAKLSKLDPSHVSMALNNGFYNPPRFKFSPEATPGPWSFGMPAEPPETNPRTAPKPQSLGNKLFGTLW